MDRAFGDCTDFRFLLARTIGVDSREGDTLLPSIKLAAIYVARQDMDYLESSVRSVLPFVESILIGIIARRPIDRQSLTAACAGSVGVGARIRPNTARSLEPCEEADETSALSRIRCIEGEWKDEAECTSALLKELWARGITHALLMQPEDVLDARDPARMLQFVREHPEAGQFLVRCLD